MTFSPISYVESLRIGSVDFVSPNEIKVLLDVEAPNNVALNAGVPRPFPRVNEYALIPTESGLLVAQIEWITIERSQYPKRRGVQDFGLLDLPYPLRKMSLNPLGLLKEKRDDETSYSFSRGVERFPSVGDPVLTPTPDQLRAIVESGEKRNVELGVSPLADGASVKVDPDRLFGRRLAILGSTGSGKSCSVAGAIRWSIEAAETKIQEKAERQKQEETNKQKAAKEKEEMKQPANARFIVLDPNGEYTSTFSGLPGVRVYGAEEDKSRGIKQLRVPIWLWNGDEWAAFAQASEKTQRPTLIQALRSVRDGAFDEFNLTSWGTRCFLRTVITTIRQEIRAGSPWGKFPAPKNFYEKLKKWKEDFEPNDAYTSEENEAINALQNQVVELIRPRSVAYASYDFSRKEVLCLLALVEKTYRTFGGAEQDLFPLDADAPITFTGGDLLRSLEANAELMGTSQYVETMLLRIRTLLSDAKLKAVIASEGAISDNDNAADKDATMGTLVDWLNSYVCPSASAAPSITVIDLSLLPAETTHIIAAVVARLTLEALQRYRKLNNGQTLPTTLVMEEAHSFIKRYNDDGENVSASKACAQVFEKIAREGRKFGLGLVLSSQRPSELSPTVLSQCNTFLLHRLTSDRDQELVAKLVPDSLRGLLRDLPSLPSQHAILLGWAAETPTLVRMNDLAANQRPKSDDPNYWAVWTGVERNVDWEAVAKDWQNIADEETPSE